MVWGNACSAVSPGLVYSQHLFVAKVLALHNHDIWQDAEQDLRLDKIGEDGRCCCSNCRCPNILLHRSPDSKAGEATRRARPSIMNARQLMYARVGSQESPPGPVSSMARDLVDMASERCQNSPQAGRNDLMQSKVCTVE